MSRELAKKALELFDTQQKWQSFIELANLKDEIVQLMFQSVEKEINKYFDVDLDDGWSYTKLRNWDYKWYLTDYGINSVCIYMWGVHIGFSNSSNCKIDELLNNEKYRSLKSLFRFDGGPKGDSNFILFESGNFIFNSEYDQNFTEDSAAWYVLNEPKKYLEQLKTKVDLIRKDKNITDLLKELNNELNT